MIKRGVGLASGVALALAAATMPGPAGLASAVQGVPAVSTPVAWVANQSVRSATKGSVTTIDTATNMVIKNIPLSRNALAVALAPDGKTAYVALNATRLGGRGAVVPVSTSTYRVGKPVRVGILPVWGKEKPRA